MADDNKKIDALVSALVDTYHSALQEGVTEATVNAAIEAVQDLNAERVKAGLKEIKVDNLETLSEALEQSEDYYTYLVEDGGSEVLDEEDELEFEPWLSDLQNELTEELELILDQADSEGWDETQIQGYIQSFKERGHSKALLTAEYEILRNVETVKRSIWGKHGLKKVQRHARHDGSTCSQCAVLDGAEYDMADAPFLPAHHKCRCYYSPLYNEDIEVDLE